MSSHRETYTHDTTCPKCREREARPDTWAVDQATCVKCAWHSQNRPEPVDPASVRVGQVVEIEYPPGSKVRRIEGVVDDVHSGVGSFLIGGKWWNVRAGVGPGPEVRVLQPAEPEPDPAAVEAFAGVLKWMIPGHDWDYEITARELLGEMAKRRMQVVSRDA